MTAPTYTSLYRLGTQGDPDFAAQLAQALPADAALRAENPNAPSLPCRLWNALICQGTSITLPVTIGQALLAHIPPECTLGDTFISAALDHPSLRPLLPALLARHPPVVDQHRALLVAIERSDAELVAILATSPASIWLDHGYPIHYALAMGAPDRILTTLLPYVDPRVVKHYHTGERWELLDRLACLGDDALRREWVSAHPGHLPAAAHMLQATERQDVLAQTSALTRRARHRS